MEDQELIKLIKNNWHLIIFIENPSEQVQLAAVKKDGEAIRFIKNFHPKVKLMILNELVKNPEIRQFLSDPKATMAEQI